MKEQGQKNCLRNGLIVSLTFMLVIAISLAGVSRGWAADFPTRPITVIVPYKAGGGSEVETRNIASVIQKYLGQPFVLKAMPGGGSTIGAAVAARAKPDGYTLLCTVLPSSLLAEKKLKTTGDVANREYIYGWSAAETSIAVSAGSPFKTFKDLLEAGKKKPLKASVAGIAAYTHLSNALVNKYSGLKTKFIPYKGGGPATTAMIRGDVDFTCVVTTTIARFVKSGQARALVVIGPSRVPHLPGVPTMDELGYKGIPFVPMVRGLSAPKGTPPERIKIIEEALRKAVEDPDFLGLMKKQGRPVTKLTREDLRKSADVALKLANEYMPILKSAGDN